MGRKALSNPVDSNSKAFYEDAPVSNFRRRSLEGRVAVTAANVRSFVPESHEDIRDNPFHGLMTGNRGVL